MNGKTVNRRLSAREAELYTAWIDNDRRVRQLLTDMRRWRPKPPHCSSGTHDKAVKGLIASLESV